MAQSAGKVMFIPKGDYNAQTTYQRLDFVTYKGSSYVAKKTTAGNDPTDTEYWQLLAKNGEAAYGTSSTEGATAAKVVSTAHGDFTLEVGSNIVVKFVNNDTAGSVTLNVDGTGAKPVTLKGTPIRSGLLTNDTVFGFVYTGENYELVSDGGSTIGEITARSTSYDNTTSSLDADNVQDAVDEITTIIKGISYDPASRSITIPGTIGVYSNRAITLAL